jgi:hypothetical protein
VQISQHKKTCLEKMDRKEKKEVNNKMKGENWK